MYEILHVCSILALFRIWALFWAPGGVSSRIRADQESRVVLPPADDGRRSRNSVAEFSEEFEVVDDDEFIDTSSDDMIFVDKGIIDPELEKFIDLAIGGGYGVCTFCKGSGLDDFGQECPMCDGLGKCVEFIESVDAVGDKQPLGCA